MRRTSHSIASLAATEYSQAFDKSGSGRRSISRLSAGLPSFDSRAAQSRRPGRAGSTGSVIGRFLSAAESVAGLPRVARLPSKSYYGGGKAVNGNRPPERSG